MRGRGVGIVLALDVWLLLKRLRESVLAAVELDGANQRTNAHVTTDEHPREA